jgi:hypothetical protein
MTKRIAILTFAVGLMHSYTSLAMDQASQKKFALLVIPGQNGLGGQNTDVVLPQFPDQPS